MDLNKVDRDKLRQSQYKLQADKSVIGNIIEHQVQDPRKYKQVSYCSGSDQTNGDALKPKPPEIKYEDIFYRDGSRQAGQLAPGPKVEPDSPIRPEDVQENQWLHMDQVEFDKLEWMTSKADKVYEEKLNSTTHFDRNGRAIAPPIKSKDNKSNSVEPLKTNISSEIDQEAHDVESLVQMLDKTYDPQVTYALNVIGRIASLASMGFYDGAFDENIHSILIQNCLLRARHHLDNPNETVCLSALKCLSSLLCNTKVDEVVLDRMFPILSGDFNPNLWSQTSPSIPEFTIEMKDSDCVDVDCIQTLIRRTDIIQRFCYLLEAKVGPNAPIYQEYILDILIRMARHSRTTCLSFIPQTQSQRNPFKILCRPQYLPLYKGTGSESTFSIAFKVLKFIRLVADAIIEHRALMKRVDISFSEDIIQSIESYYFIDCFSLPEGISEHLFKLHIETLRVMATLTKIVEYRAKIMSIINMGQEKLITSVKAFGYLKASKSSDSKISFDWQYVAHLLNILQAYSGYEENPGARRFSGYVWRDWMEPITLTWFNDIIKERLVPHIDVSIALAVALRNQTSEEYDQELLKLMADPDTHESEGVEFFQFLMTQAGNQSQLQEFTTYDGKSRDPACLPSYGFLNINTSHKHKFELTPIARVDSPFILLDAFLTKIKDKPIEALNRIKAFVDNANLTRYIRGVSNYTLFPKSYETRIQRSLPAQSEVSMISKALLVLCGYYIGNHEKCPTEGPVSFDDLVIIRETRSESYGNLCYYIISIIGLLDPSCCAATKLKDFLLGKILLDYELQSRIYNEGFPHRPNSDLSMPIVDYTGTLIEPRIAYGTLKAIAPVYLGCVQSDRFWMYQPLIEYYHTHQNGKTNNEAGATSAGIIDVIRNMKRKDGYFQFASDKTNATNDLDFMKDVEVVSSLLQFIYFMMRMSPTYCRLAILPTLEEHLCVIGTIFLDDYLFLDQKISSVMVRNIKFMLKDCIHIAHSKKLIQAPFRDASKKVTPMNITLADFFNKLLDQYEAASYADLTFSNFMLLFLAPDCDKFFKQKLLQEKRETCFGCLGRLGGDQIWVPRELYLNRRETDQEIINLLARSRSFTRPGGFLQAYIDNQTKSN